MKAEVRFVDPVTIEFFCPSCSTKISSSLVVEDGFSGGELDGGFCGCGWLYSISLVGEKILAYDLREWDWILDQKPEKLKLVRIQ